MAHTPQRLATASGGGLHTSGPVDQLPRDQPQIAGSDEVLPLPDGDAPTLGTRRSEWMRPRECCTGP